MNSSLAALLQELAIGLSAEGDQVRIQAPPGAIWPELRELLVLEKEALRADVREIALAPRPLLEALQAHARETPQRIAIRDAQEDLSYAQLWTRLAQAPRDAGATHGIHAEGSGEFVVRVLRALYGESGAELIYGPMQPAGDAAAAQPAGIRIPFGAGAACFDRDAFDQSLALGPRYARADCVLLDHLPRHPAAVFDALSVLHAGATLVTRAGQDDGVNVIRTDDAARLPELGDALVPGSWARIGILAGSVGEPLLATLRERGVVAVIVRQALLPELMVRFAATVYREGAAPRRIGYAPWRVCDRDGRPALPLGAGSLWLGGALARLARQVGVARLDIRPIDGAEWIEAGVRARVNAEQQLELLEPLDDESGVIGGWRHAPARLRAALAEVPAVAGVQLALPAQERGDERMIVALVVAAATDHAALLGQCRQALARHGCVPGAPMLLWPVARHALRADGGGDRDELLAAAAWDDADLGAWTRQLRGMHGPHSIALADTAPGFAHDVGVADLVAADFHPARRLGKPAAATIDASRAAAAAPVPAQIDAQPVEWPASAPDNLAAVLRLAAQRSAHGITFIDADSRTRELTYRQLLDRAGVIAAAMGARGIAPGSSAILQCRSNEGLLLAYWGCIIAGVVPLPQQVPKVFDGANPEVRKLLQTWSAAARPVFVCEPELRADLARALASVPSGSIAVFALDEAAPAGDPGAVSATDADAPALMFTTSGSTGTPKIVVQTHRAVLTLVHGLIRMFGAGEAHTSVNWMPLDHVGGFIMCHLRDLVSGARQIHARKEWVLEDPLRWLDLLERYRAVLSWAPNFAYALVLRHLQQEPHRRWDLGSVRSLVNGGELVVPRTMAAFQAALEPHGLRADVIHPAWGMTETSSASILRCASGAAACCADTAFASLGAPVPGMSIRIADENDRVLLEGQPGELQVRGACVTRGYFASPEQNAAAFTTDGWFRTSDVGVIRERQLYLTGRESDLIIVNGVNHVAHDLERAIEETQLVQPSFTVVCAVRGKQDDTEKVAVFFVPQASAAITPRELARTLQLELMRTQGVTAAALIPMTCEEIPKTSLGKLQRAVLRRRLQAGEFDQRTNLAEGGTRDTMPACFHRRRWQPQRAHAADLEAEASLRVLASGALGDAVAREWRARGGHARVARELDAGASDTLEKRGAPLRVMDLRLAESKVSAAAAFAQVSTLLRRLSVWRDGRDVRLFVAGCGAQRSQGETAALAPLLASAARELPWLSARLVDLDSGDVHHAPSLVEEACASGSETEVALSGARRFVRRLENVRIEPASGRELEAGGFYVLIGGLGGIGCEIAAWLMSCWDARLLVVGRDSLEEMHDAAARGEARAAEKLQRWKWLSRDGAAIRYAAATLTDTEALLARIEDARTAFGVALSGVFHLASNGHHSHVLDEARSLLRNDERHVAEEFAARMGPLPGLERLLQENAGLRVVVFSSVSAWFGGAGLSAYAAANGCCEAWVSRQRELGHERVTALTWSVWRDAGMNGGCPKSLLEMTRRAGYVILEIEQGLASLLAALATGESHVGIGVDDAHPSMRRLTVGRAAPAYAPAAFRAAARAGRESIAVHSLAGRSIELPMQCVSDWPLREDGAPDVQKLRGLVSAARSDGLSQTEQRLATVIGALLGVARVGPEETFFELGGNSLSASRLLLRIREEFAVELPMGALFGSPTLRGMAALIDGAPRTSQAMAPLERIDPDSKAPLTTAQQRLWALDQTYGSSAVYNVPLALRMEGLLDREALQRSLDVLVERHDSLRTQFRVAAGAAHQEVAHGARACIDHIDLRGHEPAAVQARLDELARCPIALDRAPLMKVHLLACADDVCVLLINIHHIVCDGWSLAILAQEMQTLYGAFTSGREVELPPLTIRFADYAAWLQRPDVQQHWEAGKRYWSDVLRDAPPTTDLPTQRSRSDFAGASFHHRFDAALARGLRERAQRDDISLFTLLLAGFGAMLARVTGQRDLVVGTTVANRPRVEFEPVVGYFVNNLPLRVQVDAQDPLEDVLARSRECLLGAMEHSHIPFEKILESVEVKRSLATAPLFQVMLVLQNTPPLAALDSAQLRVEPLATNSGESKFDLSVIVTDDGAGLSVHVEYANGKYDRDDVDSWLEVFRTFLECLATRGVHTVAGLPLSAPSVTIAAAPGGNADATVFDVFAAWCARQPEAAAVVSAERTVSYGALEGQVERVAAALENAGASPGDIVAVCLPRGVELIACVLAIWRCGCTYLPLDARWPAARLQDVLEDAAPRLLVTRAEVLQPPSVPAMKIIDAEAAASGAARPRAPARVSRQMPAYLIYTSGTSGRPKGVSVPQCGLLALQAAQGSMFTLTAGSRVLMFAAPTFDASIWEIGMSVLNGGALCPIDEDTKHDAHALYQVLHECGITHATLPPALARVLDPARCPSLEHLIVAGEACPASLPAQWLRHCRFHNAYGPTEASVCATIKTFRAENEAVTIGGAIPGMRTAVLNEDLRPQPRAAVGELFLSGEALALGYLHRAALTAERFLPDPAATRPGSRMYRTGDRVFVNADGELVFIGRSDEQVKVRGHRIELGEIEAVLSMSPAVLDCAVIVQRAGTEAARLVAYVVAPRADPPVLWGLMRKRLANYMLPAQLVMLEALPRTISGKVDRARLPTPADAQDPAADAVELSATERDVAQAMQQVLGAKVVRAADDFFMLGGDSVSAIALAEKLRGRGYTLRTRQIFESPGVAQIAALLERAGEGTAQRRHVGPFELSPIMRWFFEQRFENPHHWNQVVLLQAPDVSPARALRACDLLLERHDAFHARYRRTESGWTASIPEVRAPLRSVAVDLSGLPADLEPRTVRAIVDAAHRSLDICTGPLVRALVLKLGTGATLPLLVTHHLACDVVSATLLNERFAQWVADPASAAPADDASAGGIPQWAAHLRELASQMPDWLSDERRHWQALGEQAPRPLPRDITADNHVSDLRVASLSMPEALSGALIAHGARAYNAGVEELCMAALFQALHDWRGLDELYVDVEGHGRELAGRGPDVTRSVGWFTALRPLHVGGIDPEDTAAVIMAAKKGLRGVRGGGVGFGLLKYLAASDGGLHWPSPQISANFLGTHRVDRGLFDALVFEGLHAPENHRTHTLELNYLVRHGRLEFFLGYSAAEFHACSIEDLGAHLRARLESMMAHCADTEFAGFSPDDFPDLDLPHDVLDSVVREIEAENH